MKLKYSPNVIGCKIGDEIYVNPHLSNDKLLFSAILTHEKKHSGTFTPGDFKLDLINSDLRKVRGLYWKFMFKHPRAMLSLLPITKVDKYWGFDISLTLFWAFALIIIGMAILL